MVNAVDHFDVVRQRLAAVPEPVVRAGECAVWAPRGRRLGPPLSESRIRAFETVNQVNLPASYRTFLKTIGDGGVGPGGGLEEIAYWRSCEVPGIPLRSTIEGEECRVLAVANHGCTDATLLALDGAHSGRLFSRIGDGKPDLLDPPSFAAWYQHWLEQPGHHGHDLTPRRDSDHLRTLLRTEQDCCLRSELVRELASTESLDHEFQTLLIDLARNDENAHVRAAVIDVLIDCLEDPYEVLLDAVSDPSRQPARRAIVQLFRVAGGEPTWGLALDLARAHADPVLRTMAETLETGRERGITLGAAQK